MNGAINSSPQAKLAHIANGNFNGPVGLAASLAVADYEGGDIDQAAIDAANGVLGFDQAAADQALQDQIDALALAGITDAASLQAELDAKAQEQGFADYQDYLANSDGAALIDDSLEDLLAGTTAPTQEELDAAQATIDAANAVTDAENALLDAWNKGDADDPHADALLEAIRASNPTPEEVAAAMASAEEGDAEGEGEGEGEEGEGGEETAEGEGDVAPEDGGDEEVDPFLLAQQ